jgi:hypothetical protein
VARDARIAGAMRGAHNPRGDAKLSANRPANLDAPSVASQAQGAAIGGGGETEGAAACQGCDGGRRSGSGRATILLYPLATHPVIFTFYSLRIKDPRTGRWRTLQFKLTEKDANAWAERECIELEMVPNTSEHREGRAGRSLNRNSTRSKEKALPPNPLQERQFAFTQKSSFAFSAAALRAARPLSAITVEKMTAEHLLPAALHCIPILVMGPDQR